MAKRSGVESIKARLHARADPSRVPVLQRFFKTLPGQYGEGDRFIGATVPDVREVCRECGGATLDEIDDLLHSDIHEERLLALLLAVDAFKRGDAATRRRVFDLYLANTKHINNWDLVDSSAPGIAGAYLFDRSRAPLARLARSRSLWERRIAIVATQYFIRQGDIDDTLSLADRLLADEHDLIHKAVGWMLREAGKQDAEALRAWLKPRCTRMPRTMLRYAIEKFPEAERRRYLRGAL